VQAAVAAGSMLVVAIDLVHAPNDKQQLGPMLGQPHHPPLAERFEQAPAAPENPTPVEAMAYRLNTPEGRKLYALRKQTPEPVFGIIKSAIRFRQFALRAHTSVCLSSAPPDAPGRELAQRKSRRSTVMGGHTAICARSSIRRKLAVAKWPSAFSRNASKSALCDNFRNF
jgi:hypothetical protein